MAFGFLFDFTGYSNVSRVFNASQVVNQKWFREAIAGRPDGRSTALPIDLFVGSTLWRP